MKRLIRNKQTKQFLTKEGNWTSDISAAEEFDNISLAIIAKQDPSLSELLIMMGDRPSVYDVVLPLGNG